MSKLRKMIGWNIGDVIVIRWELFGCQLLRVELEVIA